MYKCSNLMTFVWHTFGTHVSYVTHICTCYMRVWCSWHVTHVCAYVYIVVKLRSHIKMCSWNSYIRVWCSWVMSCMHIAHLTHLCVHIWQIWLLFEFRRPRSGGCEMVHFLRNLCAKWNLLSNVAFCRLKHAWFRVSCGVLSAIYAPTTHTHIATQK